MKTEILDVYVNFRISKEERDELDKRALEKGVSRARIARQLLEQGVKLPQDVPLTFAMLLYERTDEMHEIKEIKEEAVAIIKELFYVTKN